MAGGGGTTGMKPTPLPKPTATSEGDGLIGGGAGEGAMLGGCCSCCACCCALTTIVPVEQGAVSASCSIWMRSHAVLHLSVVLIRYPSRDREQWTRPTS